MQGPCDDAMVEATHVSAKVIQYFGDDNCFPNPLSHMK